MNTNLAPTYQQVFGEYWVLWYAVSNSYSIIESDFKLLLEAYLTAETPTQFSSTISNDLSVSNNKPISETLVHYLKACNIPSTSPNENAVALDTSHRKILKEYSFNGKTIQIYYSSEQVSKTIHPALAYYSTAPSNSIHTTFDLYLEQEDLFLFKDAQLISHVSKYKYHKIQGKFIMHLLCTLHNNAETDWIGTFHGSTITDGNSAILFVGESGKGKSTLCALLVANGFNLLADDVSPMLSENKHIYYNPSSISIKKGAFKMLQLLISDFDMLPIIKFNESKGDLKYLPCKRPKKNHYPCKAIILVNYKPEAETKLEHISIKTILETLIPDSWISPKPKHAKQFLDWLKTVSLYQLTYSDTQSVSAEIAILFRQLHKKAE